VKKGIFFIPLLASILFWCPANADETVWTEKKLAKVAIKAYRASVRKKWSRAIRYGEQTLAGCIDLRGETNAKCITRLSSLLTYYDEANRLDTVGVRVKSAYELASQHLDVESEVALTIRNLYYKLLVERKDYMTAIPLAEENVRIYEKDRIEDYKAPHYLTQLYSLYGLTGQYEKEEKTLLELLNISVRLFGEEDEDNVLILLSLARNYCRQNKRREFDQLIQAHSLKYVC